MGSVRGVLRFSFFFSLVCGGSEVRPSVRIYSGLAVGLLWFSTLCSITAVKITF
jgi:hypothetical protein